MNFHYDDESHTYTVDSRPVPSVTEILKAEGFIDVSHYQEYGRNRGKLAHLAIHLHDMGELDEESLDPVLGPYLEAWKAFRADTGLTIIESETPIVDPLKRYAGTPDKVVLLDGKQTIIDIKTGAVMEPWVSLQLAAYGEAKTIYRRVAVQLKSDETYKIFPFTDRQDFAIWNATLAVYWWKRNELKRRG